MKTKPTGKIGKSSTPKKEAKKEFYKSPGRAKMKGRKMIIPAETVMRKIGTLETRPVAIPKAGRKAKASFAPPPTLCLALQEVKDRGTGVLSFPVESLAMEIRNAYKGAKAGKQETKIIERIKSRRGQLNILAIARALVASGIPAHRAGKVAMDWDTMASPAGKRAVTLLRQSKQDDADLIQALDALERAHPEYDWSTESDALRGRLIKHMHKTKVYDPEIALSELMNKSGPDLPKTAADCPAYLKRIFDAAPADRIAQVTGEALDRVLTLYGTDRFAGTMLDFLINAGVPSAWHYKIINAARDADEAKEQRERKAEEDKRKTQAPGAEAPKPKAEVPKTFNPSEWVDHWYARHKIDSLTLKECISDAADYASAEAARVAHLWDERSSVRRLIDDARRIQDEEECISVIWEAVKRMSPVPTPDALSAILTPVDWVPKLRILDKFLATYAARIESSLVDEKSAPMAIDSTIVALVNRWEGSKIKNQKGWSSPKESLEHYMEAARVVSGGGAGFCVFQSIESMAWGIETLIETIPESLVDKTPEVLAEGFTRFSPRPTSHLVAGVMNHVKMERERCKARLHPWIDVQTLTIYMRRITTLPNTPIQQDHLPASDWAALVNLGPVERVQAEVRVSKDLAADLARALEATG